MIRMNLVRRNRITRYLTVGTVGGALLWLASSGNLASACGPFNKVAVFSHDLHPDFPLTLFAQGRLGVIKPTYARSYLVVAYRILTDRKITPEMAKDSNALWRHRLVYGDVDVQSAADSWLKARKLVPSIPLDPQMDVYSFIYGGGSYLRYTAESLNKAAELLKSKVTKYGAKDPRVLEWVKAQDAVFAYATYDKKGAVELHELPQNADAEAKAERAYQIACQKFYSEDFDDAVERFRAIAKDSTS